MSERLFRVSDAQPGDDMPVEMTEAELRLNYPFSADVLELAELRRVVVEHGAMRLEVNAIVEPTNQHRLP